MTEYHQQQLTLDAFETQISKPENSELVNNSKYGVHELINNEWVTKEIVESDIESYFICTNVDSESDEFVELNNKYSHYPFVVLK